MSEVNETVQADTRMSSDEGREAAEGGAPEAHVDAEAAEDEAQAAGQEKLVPVTEAIRYRKRAQAAEQRLGELNERLEALHGELSEARQTVSHLERRQQMDALLAEAEAIDLETARLLTERAVEQMSEPDVRLAVDDLRRTKPYLFRQRAAESGGAMAAREEAGCSSVDEAAERAVHTGDRGDLLHYLRVRRQK